MFLEMVYSDAHEIHDIPRIHALSIQTGRKTIQRFIMKYARKPEQLSETMGTALCTCGEILAISAWNARMLMDIANQAMSKYNTLSQ